VFNRTLIITYLSTNFGFAPDQTGCIQNIKVIEPRIAVMTPMEVDFVTMDCSSVIISTCRCRSKCFRLVTRLIDIAHIRRRLWHRGRVIYWWAITKEAPK